MSPTPITILEEVEFLMIVKVVQINKLVTKTVFLWCRLWTSLFQVLSLFIFTSESVGIGSRLEHQVVIRGTALFVTLGFSFSVLEVSASNKKKHILDGIYYHLKNLPDSLPLGGSTIRWWCWDFPRCMQLFEVLTFPQRFCILFLNTDVSVLHD